MAYKAVFLDRDDTIIDDPGYLSTPDGLHILPGVPLAIKSLRQAGYKIVVVTNQSGIARGLLTEETLERIHAKLREMLADKGAMIDAIYYCPFHPDGSVDKYRRESDLRKPQPGMLFKAAEQLSIDLASSWMVGDSLRDIEAGQAANCQTIQITTTADEQEESDIKPDHTAKNVVEAARIIMHSAKSAAAAAEDSRQESEPPQAKENSMETPTPQQPDETNASVPAANETESQESVNSEESYSTAEEVQEAPVQSEPELHRPAFSLNKPEIEQPEETEHDSNVRREILQHVRQISKQNQHEEFSLTSLLGGLTQALTILFLLMTMWIGLNKGESLKAIMWGVIALIFQTMSLTFFTMSKKHK